MPNLDNLISVLLKIVLMISSKVLFQKSYTSDIQEIVSHGIGTNTRYNAYVVWQKRPAPLFGEYKVIPLQIAQLTVQGMLRNPILDFIEVVLFSFDA